MSEIEEQIAEDFRLLDRVEHGAPGFFRVWCCDSTAVVLGRALRAEQEVDIDYCSRAGIPVLRRGSGGGAVLIGPGTLQYAFALPYALSPELEDIRCAKRLCNRLLLIGLGAREGLTAQPCGDLSLYGDKVAGLAMRRKRKAVLVHGTILMSADLELIDRALRHPSREPEYRRGRRHRDFVRNLGPIDGPALQDRIARLLLDLG